MGSLTANRPGIGVSSHQSDLGVPWQEHGSGSDLPSGEQSLPWQNFTWAVREKKRRTQLDTSHAGSGGGGAYLSDRNQKVQLMVRPIIRGRQGKGKGFPRISQQGDTDNRDRGGYILTEEERCQPSTRERPKRDAINRKKKDRPDGKDVYSVGAGRAGKRGGLLHRCSKGSWGNLVGTASRGVQTDGGGAYLRVRSFRESISKSIYE